MDINRHEFLDASCNHGMYGFLKGGALSRGAGHAAEEENENQTATARILGQRVEGNAFHQKRR